MVAEVIDPEIKEFETYFQQEKVGGTGLMQFERELLRSYLHWKLTGGVR